MASFRVPYPTDPERRKALHAEGIAQISKFGECEGTPDSGQFWGKTPIGDFAGAYEALDSGEIVFEISKKPMLVSMSMIESEARKFLSRG